MRTSAIILTFHGVGPIPRQIDDGERHCWVDQNDFEIFLDVIREHSSVRLTVDDGNASDFEIVLPALLRRGLHATFFICSGRLDQPMFLTQAQVRELRTQGMSVGSHGVNHVSWRKLPGARLVDELEGSQRRLEEVCGVPIETAACPFGTYDRKVITGLHQAGYREVYTSDEGSAADSDWLKARTTVTRSMTPRHVERLIVEGPGRWKQASINLRKLIKRFV